MGRWCARLLHFNRFLHILILTQNCPHKLQTQTYNFLLNSCWAKEPLFSLPAWKNMSLLSLARLLQLKTSGLTIFPVRNTVLWGISEWNRNWMNVFYVHPRVWKRSAWLNYIGAIKRSLKLHLFLIYSETGARDHGRVHFGLKIVKCWSRSLWSNFEHVWLYTSRWNRRCGAFRNGIKERVR